MIHYLKILNQNVNVGKKGDQNEKLREENQKEQGKSKRTKEFTKLKS